MSTSKYDDEDRYAVTTLAQKGYSTMEIAQITGVKAGTVKKWMAGKFNCEAAKARRAEKAEKLPDLKRPLPPGAVKVGGHVWLKLTGWGAR